MLARKGPAPWQKTYAPIDFSTKKLHKQKSTLTAGNMSWDLSSGWHTKNERGWKSNVKKPEKVEYHLADGRKVILNKYNANNTIGFHAHEDAYDNDELFAFTMNAFNTKKGTASSVIEQEGCGHIAKLRYAEREQLLWVEFTNNRSVCIFYRVPSCVAGELIYHAKTGNMMTSPSNGEQRHVLGIEFWNLVRIRGQQHGARYPFEYLRHGNYQLTQSNKRYKVTLSDKNMKYILGPRYYTMNLKPGDSVTTLLSEEKYAKYIQQAEEQALHKEAVKSEKRISVVDKDTGADTREVEGVDIDYYSGYQATKRGDTKYIHEVLGTDADRYIELQQQLVNAAETTRSNVEQNIQDLIRERSESIKPELWSKYMADPMYQNEFGKPDLNKISRKILKDAVPELYDNRYKDAVEKSSVHNISVAIKDVLTDKRDYNDYLRFSALLRKKEKPQKYAQQYVGTPWTIQQLIDFQNPAITGNISLAHAAQYKKLIASKNYEAALNFLKNNKHELFYMNENTGKTASTGRIPYANRYDYIVQEDK